MGHPTVAVTSPVHTRVTRAGAVVQHLESAGQKLQLVQVQAGGGNRTACSAGAKVRLVLDELALISRRRRCAP